MKMWPQNTPKARMIDAHIWIMMFVWMVAVPAGIGVAVYGRHYNKPWWAKAHMMIMGFGVAIPMTVGAILGIVATKGFLPRSHLILGTIIVFGAWIQIGLGIVNHIIFRKYGREKGAKRPVQNTIHVWLGRILGVLSLVNIPLGMHMHHSGLPWYISYTVWVTLLCFGSIGLFWKIMNIHKKEHQQQQQEMALAIEQEVNEEAKEDTQS